MNTIVMATPDTYQLGLPLESFLKNDKDTMTWTSTHNQPSWKYPWRLRRDRYIEATTVSFSISGTLDTTNYGEEE